MCSCTTLSPGFCIPGTQVKAGCFAGVSITIVLLQNMQVEIGDLPEHIDILPNSGGRKLQVSNT